MFFGNLHQSWAEFVLADLGVFRYEAVPLDAAPRARSRSPADVDTYLALSACRQALDEEGADAAALLQALAAARTALRRGWSSAARGSCCAWARPASVRTTGRWPHRPTPPAAPPVRATARSAMLERMQCSDQALALAGQALAAPESEEEHQRVARMLPRLRRSLGAGRRAAPAGTGPGRGCAAHGRGTARAHAAPVGEHALRAYWHCAGAPVFYVENTLVNALFGLLCWPAILRRCRARSSTFQAARPTCGRARLRGAAEALFDACLAELHDGRYRATILQRFEEARHPVALWPGAR